ncbi:uncharacterized protein LOC117169066 [Belonocnema kinseyi]|uniref:uncharacterized protein LOC117169066 n=1 Tax=Belonocnema kinseyi TaxID=2817044 RepID=UPI00143D9806|nr:uncharacterized protein LOC117169066 [Belonocnema kinseyi]
METVDDLALYFYIACGISAFGFLLLFLLVIILFVKVKRLSVEESNQLSRQANMMADFCYTNPTIVPGEELSRRGFSMYNGNEHFSEDFASKSKYTGGIYQLESRSKF